MATTDAAMPTMYAPYVVVDDFLPLETAEAMRWDIEAHFAKYGSHRPDTHQVWNYWFVPGLYTYLRTSPEKLIKRDRVEHFMQVLRGWSADALGLREVTCIRSRDAHQSDHDAGRSSVRQSDRSRRAPRPDFLIAKVHTDR